jgi:hypothetical protein
MRFKEREKKLANPNDAFENQKETRLFLGFFFFFKKKETCQPGFNLIFYPKIKSFKKKSYFTLVPPNISKKHPLNTNNNYLN